jgi:processing peptidase subunit beta
LLASKAGGLTLNFPQSLLNVPETKVTSLKNGFRVASETTPVETATVGVWIDVGSRAETAKNNGVAHFLEHLAFKGTSNRSQSQIELEFENIGGHLNAYTSREQTVYFAKVLKKDVSKAIDVLADILQNSSFSQNQIEAERGVILTEMKEVEKQTQELVFDHLHATAFQSSSLGRTILGPIENIKSISQNDLKEFVKTHYTAPNMVLAAAGGVEHEDLIKLAEKAFGSLPSNTPQVAHQPAKFIGSEIRSRNDELKEAHIAFAVEGAGFNNPDYFPLMVVQFIMGSWDRSLGGGKNLSSKLAQTVAQHGLCNSYTAFNTCYSDTGLFGFYTVTATKTRLDDLMFQFQNDWVRICVNATEAEVERAKTQLKSSFLTQLDGTTPICEDIGRQMLLYGRRMTPFEINARIDAIDAATVRKVAYKYLYDKDPAIVAYGPIEGFPDYNKLQTATHWLRV